MATREFARENGWAQLAARAAGSAIRRFRDQFTARKLGAAGFRCGRHPRLLGLAHMHIGAEFSGGDNLWLEAITAYGTQRFNPRLTIGAHANLSDGVHIACIAAVTIGDGFLCGSQVIITDHAHGNYRGPGASVPDQRPGARPLHSAAPVIIGRNVWLGDGVAVLAGANIGDGCVIGANSVVTGSIAPGSIAVGAPARAVRRWDSARSEWVPLVN